MAEETIPTNKKKSAVEKAMSANQGGSLVYTRPQKKGT